jgi:hypothetical protein
MKYGSQKNSSDNSFAKVFSAQLELPIRRDPYPDRNYAHGGRSFYFFDFDDNVVFLPTPLFLFHKQTGREKLVSTREFAVIHSQIGKDGPWKNYEIRLCEQTGSFRRFRQKEMTLIDRLLRRKQPIHEDLISVIDRPHHEWRGPSWDFFWHAVHNARPLSIITARGHHPESLKNAITLLTRKGHLSRDPNYLSVYPVSHIPTRQVLGDDKSEWSTARLKQEAIKASVREAFRIYGQNPHHRFGMSDDDPSNVRLIVAAMQDLKREFPHNSFFVIDTQGGQLFKQEVAVDSVKAPEPMREEQLALF